MQAKYGLVTPETLQSMSGLEFLSGIASGRLPQPPIAETLGFRLVEVERGRAVFAGTPARGYLNPLGTIHGGYAGTLLDSCMACSVQTMLERGNGYTTLEYKVHLVRPMTEATGPVRAEGRVVHAGRRAATAEGRITDDKGNVLAHGTTTCLVFPL
ncbi:MAG: PaaI family thioesterase [Hyphomicrobiaceae bacterium]|nr:MAG: PaaI family thioesterase [Hyphomicrobiaceae bacterium]